MQNAEPIAKVPLPDRYVAIVAANIEDVLAAQDEDGSFSWGKAAKPFHPSAQTPIWPLAFLYATPNPHNPFCGDVRLRDAAIRVGDFLVANSDSEGRVTYNQAGYEITGHVDQWLWHAWLETWLLLRDELGDERNARWRQRIEAGARSLTGPLREWNAIEAPFHTRTFGTSPNHAVTRAGFIRRAAEVFDVDEWREMTDTFVGRYLKLQDADGCWCEYEGPVISYAMVSLQGLGLYYELTGDADVRAAIERTIGYLSRVWFPDGGPIALVDGRQQHTSGGSPWAHFALSLTEEGRGLCDFLTRVMIRHGSRYGHGGLYRLVEDCVYYHDGKAGRMPLEDTSFTHRFNRTAGVRRDGPWMWALSGIVTPKFEENPWSMDRQTLLTLHHASAGLVLNGAQCKQRPEASTFINAADPTDHVPICTSLDDAVTHLDTGYQWFRTTLSVAPTSPTTFEIHARLLTRAVDGPVLFKLQPAAAYGETVKLDDASRDLADDDWAVEGVRTLSWGKVTLKFDIPAKVWWPFRGYNSYSSEHTYPDLHAARLIVEVPLTMEDAKRRVTVGISAE